MNPKDLKILSRNLAIPVSKIESVLSLFEEGTTIPFIARYRKEKTGGLDEVQIFNIKEASERLKGINSRKYFILETLRNQNVLNAELESRLINSYDIREIEDIYLPFKPKKRSRATIAIEAGLEPLAKIIMSQRTQNLHAIYSARFSKLKLDYESAIKGAQDIIAEWVSENEKVRNIVRRYFEKNCFVEATVVKGCEAEAAKYKNYFNYSKLLKYCNSHHYLAIIRGESKGYLKKYLRVADDELIDSISNFFIRKEGSAEYKKLIKDAVKDGYKRLLKPSVENEILKSAKENADNFAIGVFKENVRELLMEPPVGKKRIMGIDPGFRTGCKIACIDEEGNLLATEAIFPHPPHNKSEEALTIIKNLLCRYAVDLIAVGNGTAGRETVEFLEHSGIKVKIHSISESGASIYSASECARKEFPDIDVSYRGAISIARRLLDPLAELVKIDPKSIGVGQYQHEVDQKKLNEGLGFIVESCVNSIGIDINTASVELLSFVSGLTISTAANIVEYRKANGRFNKRSDLLRVPRLGRKTYEQCVAFLRISDGENPLDNTGIHPERYQLVSDMAKRSKLSLSDIIGQPAKVNSIDFQAFIDADTGPDTLEDIKGELLKPGKDPRKKEFSEHLYEIHLKSFEDLRLGMERRGRVTNVTAFGAFVDIGLKINGLIHISKLSDKKYVSNPLEIIRVGQEVMVRIIDIDQERERIGLSLISK